MFDSEKLLGKKLYFDTNPLIYMLSGNELYLDIITQIFYGLHQRQYIGCSSQLGLAELLVKPIRENDTAQITTIYQLFSDKFLQLLPHNRACFELAAKIRADYRLKMPDAIHVATAIVHQMDILVTADNDIANRVKEIHIINLNDYLI